MPNCITDMETWLLDFGDRLYRYLVYRRMFTPYEQAHAFSDQDVFEESHYTLCRIVEAINLGNDWLLGLQRVDDDGLIRGIVDYYKLSEIRLAFFENDQSIELYENTKGEDDE